MTPSIYQLAAQIKKQNQPPPDLRKSPLYMAPGNFKGVVAPGTIDLTQLPVIENPDGSYSTVNSTSFQDEKEGSPTYGKEVLVPGILNGKRVDPDDPKVMDQIRQQYYKTGKHLGVFENGDAADAYGSQLHSDWEAGKIPGVQMRKGDPNAKNQPPWPTPAAPVPDSLGYANQREQDRTGK